MYDWFYHRGYFYTRLPEKLLSMHSLIFGSRKNNKNVIDHINRNKTDNRKENLREVSPSIKSTNAAARSDKTQDLPRGIIYQKENLEPRPDGKGQKRYASFEVQWSIEGKRHSKTFSINKAGGYEKALQLAKEFKKQKLEEMKIQSDLV